VSTTAHGAATVRWIAFEGPRLLASGAPSDVASRVKQAFDEDPHAAVLVFDAGSSERIELSWHGSLQDVLRQLPPIAQEIAEPAPEPVAPRGRGRPKLGVVAREVTLLPRHWEWLNAQPGGASVALRKLVEEARRVHAGRDLARQSRESAYRFMSAMGSNLENFEEASRALFAGDRARFASLLRPWPAAIREHLLGLAAASFAAAPSPD